ncbi:MAG TPA: YhgE/Pip domain-containing protein, partial [Agathobacter rectalis]|nr:YhgE/Pip domain-containing protein [Agathobacter rectalis]
MLDTFAMLTDSADSLIGSTQSLLPSVQGLIDGGQSSVSGMQSSVLSGAQTAQTITQMVDISLSNINSQLDVLENSIQLLNASGLADADTADISVSVAGFDTVEQLAENTLSAIEGLKGVDSSQIEAVRKNIQSIKTQIKDLKSDTELTADKLKLLKESIKADVSSAKSAIDTLKNTFDHSVSPNLT